MPKSSAEIHREQIGEIVAQLERKIAHDRIQNPGKVAVTEKKLADFRAQLVQADAATAQNLEPK